MDARQRAIRTDLASLQPVPRLDPVVIDNCLSEWRRLLRQSTTQGRAVLQRLLRGRLMFTPRADGRGYDFSGPTRFDKLFTDLVARRPAWMDPNDRTGTEEIHAEYDADYGRLLEQAYGKGVAPPKRIGTLFRERVGRSTGRVT